MQNPITFLLRASIVALATLAQLAFAQSAIQSFSATRAVDLTHAMHDAMAFWPGGVPFHKQALVTYESGGYLLHKFEMGENTGTHVDAPAHFIKGKNTIEQLPLQQLILPLAVIDVKHKVRNNVDYQLSAADIRAWEKKYGKVPKHSLFVMNSGWHAKFDAPQQYINLDADDVMHFPGYSPQAAELLVARDVAGIGIDTLSLDYGGSKDFAVHVVMLRANKYQVENLANLDALPPTGATAVVGVLPVIGGSQAQARVFALLP